MQKVRQSVKVPQLNYPKNLIRNLNFKLIMFTCKGKLCTSTCTSIRMYYVYLPPLIVIMIPSQNIPIFRGRGNVSGKLSSLYYDISRTRVQNINVNPKEQEVRHTQQNTLFYEIIIHALH